MSGNALVALGIALDRPGWLEIALELRLDALEPGLERGVGALVPCGVLAERLLERLNALVRERVRTVVTVLGVDREAIFLVLQLAEEFQEALPAGAGVVEIFDRGLVGRGLLRAGEGEKLAERCLLAGHQHREARFGGSRRDGERSKHEGREGEPAGVARAVLDADRVAAGDVAELVRDHPLNLIDVVRRLDQPAVQIDRLAGCDEGVNLRVVEQDDVDILRIEPRRHDHRAGNFAEQRLGLAVAKDLAALRRCRGGSGEEQQDRKREQAKGFGGRRQHRALITTLAGERAIKTRFGPV